MPGFKLNSYGRRAFSVAAPLLWNSLPEHVRHAESLDIFKRQLKTVLFKRAFYKLIILLKLFILIYLLAFYFFTMNIRIFLAFLMFYYKF